MEFRGYLCVCAMVRDETGFLDEWAAYHLLLGADRLLLFDNESRIPVRRTLAKYVDAGLVRVEDIAGVERQIPAYGTALGRFGRDFEWMAFIDADEFLLPMKDATGRHRDLPGILTRFENHAGLAVNWAMFGSSGHEACPGPGQLAHYVHRYPLEAGVNATVKSLVRPALTLRPESPHHFKFARGHCAVNTSGLPVNAPYSPVCGDVLRVNHYFFRSREDFARKIERGRGDLSTAKFRHQPAAFDVMLDLAVEEDRDIQRHLPGVREIMAANHPAEALDRLRGPKCGDLEEVRSRIMVLLNAEDAASAHDLAVRACSEIGGGAAWLTRAFTARMLPGAEALDEARLCIERALRIEDSFEAHHQLMMLRLQAGDRPGARTTARYIRWRLDKGTFKVDGELARKVLAEINDILGDQPKLREIRNNGFHSRWPRRIGA